MLKSISHFSRRNECVPTPPAAEGKLEHCVQPNVFDGVVVRRLGPLFILFSDFCTFYTRHQYVFLFEETLKTLFILLYILNFEIDFNTIIFVLFYNHY